MKQFSGVKFRKVKVKNGPIELTLRLSSPLQYKRLTEILNWVKFQRET